MRKYLPHILIISFVFFLTPTIQAVSDVEREIEELKQAIRINPDDADAHFDLGVAYHFSNDRGSAMEQYKILKTLDPERANKLFNLINE